MAVMLKKPADYRGPNFRIVSNPEGLKLFHDIGVGSNLPWKPGKLPVVARQEKAYRGQLDDITAVYSSVGVSRKFRDLVESFEPGVHAFSPLILERKNGEQFGEYFLFVLQQDIDCIITDNRIENFRYIPGFEPEETRILCTLTQPAKTIPISRQAVAGKHLWTAGLLGRSEMFVSDEFHAAFKATCKGHLSTFWTSVVEVDRPWVAEEQMGPLLARHLDFVASGKTRIDLSIGDLLTGTAALWRGG